MAFNSERGKLAGQKSVRGKHKCLKQTMEAIK